MTQETTPAGVTGGDGERRGSRRAQVDLAVTLSRHNGGPVHGRTVDLSVGGMRVATTRPLRTDEVLDFAVPIESVGPLVQGRARVMREQARNVYALRFEHIAPDAASCLSDFVSSQP